MLRVLFCLSAAVLAAIAPLRAAPLGTAFTYQGELKRLGARANGAFDFQFEIFELSASGINLAPPALLENVNVVDGVFTVELDFGPMPFAGEQLWLEVGVREGSSSGGYTGLLPRQKITAAPYALYAEFAGNAVYSAGTGLALSGNVFRNTGDLSASNELQALSLSGNTLSLSRNGGSVALPDTQWLANGDDIYNMNAGNVGIGTAAPVVPLHVVNPQQSSEAIRISGSGSWLAFWDGLLYDGFLWNNAGSIGLGTSHLNSSGDLRFHTFGSQRMVIRPSGFIGIGTATPSYALHVEAPGIAIHGRSTNNYGLYGYSSGQIGIYGYSNAAGSAGIFGQSAYIGVEGITNSGSTDTSRQGVRGDNHGSVSGWAGYFFGNVGVSGSLSKGAGAFKIDHPLDPENKFLYHSFVESPDMKNIYDGLVVTDAAGEATVAMPEWFDALNRDFRYQLTVIGSFARAIIAEEMRNNQFKIKTDAPQVKVSWQVTGIRQDAFANQHRIPVEVEKTAAEKGKYLHPDAFGKSVQQAIDFNVVDDRSPSQSESPD